MKKIQKIFALYSEFIEILNKEREGVPLLNSKKKTNLYFKMVLVYSVILTLHLIIKIVLNNWKWS